MSPETEALLECKHKATVWQDTRTHKHFKQVLPVGSWNRPGCYHYAKWQPVKRFWKFFWADDGKPFWLEPWPSLEQAK